MTYDSFTNTVRINTDDPYIDEAPVQPSRTVTLPTDGSQYIPQVGNIIPCNDGAEYKISDAVFTHPATLLLMNKIIKLSDRIT